MSSYTLYQSKINPQRNMKIEQIENYLNSIPNDQKLIFSNGQYFPIKLSTELVLNLNQDYFDGMNGKFERLKYNYLRVNNNKKIYYFFIVKTEWIGKSAIKFSLVMDTINSYSFGFTAKTKIIREHQDRFYKDSLNLSSKKIMRKIDKFDEASNLPQYQFDRRPISKANYDMDFHLIYRTSRDLTTQNLYDVVECLMVGDAPILVKKGETGGNPTTINFGIDERKGHIYYIDPINNPIYEFKFYNTTYKNQERVIYAIWSPSKKVPERGVYLYKLTYRYENNIYSLISKESIGGLTNDNAYVLISSMRSLGVFKANKYEFLTDWYEIVELQERETINVGATGDQFTIPFSKYNRADLKNIKIIDLPYSPTPLNKKENGEVDFDDMWKFSDGGYFKLNNINSKFGVIFPNRIDFSEEFECELPIDSEGSTPLMLRDDKYESKLFKSDFYTYQLTYDSFSLEIPLETCLKKDLFDGKKYDILFKPTNTMTSNFMFRINGMENDFLKVGNYPFTLISTRNNEEVIFNSSYTDYVKNGYNFDIKNKNRSNTMNWLNTGIQTAGAVVSGLLSIPTGGLSLVAGAGFVTSSISSIASNINANIQAEQNINQKLNSLKNSTTNVAGANDVDLLKTYNSNRLLIFKSKISEELEKNFADLFYYFGYSHPVFAEPDPYSRYWFNFLQCEADFDDSTILTVPTEYLDDISARLKIGVTYFHYRGEYDFDQIQENWEVWL